MRRLRCAAIAGAALVMPALAADYAPVNCAKATSKADKTICANYALGQADAREATLFGIAMSLVAMGQRGDIGDAQKQWFKTREACRANVACLTKVYDARIQEIKKVLDGIASKGPY